MRISEIVNTLIHNRNVRIGVIGATILLMAPRPSIAGWDVTYVGAGYSVSSPSPPKTVTDDTPKVGGIGGNPGGSEGGLNVYRGGMASVAYMKEISPNNYVPVLNPVGAAASATFTPIFAWVPYEGESAVAPKEIEYEEYSWCDAAVMFGPHEAYYAGEQVAVDDASDTPTYRPFGDDFPNRIVKYRRCIRHIAVSNPCATPGLPVYLSASAAYSGTIDIPNLDDCYKYASVAMGAYPINRTIRVRRKGTTGPFSGSAYIAAGGKGTDEHMAEIQVAGGWSSIEMPFSTPIIKGGEGRGGTRAYITRNSNTATDDQGNMVIGILHSSDTLENVTLLPATGSEGDANSATVAQVWDEGNEWKNDIFYRYDEAKKVRFKPKFHDYSIAGYPAVKMKQHQMEFKPKAIDILIWSGGDFVSRHLTADSEDAHERWLVENYAVFDSGAVQDVGDGVYETGLTVKYDKHRAVTNVDIGVKDLGVFKDVPKPTP